MARKYYICLGFGFTVVCTGLVRVFFRRLQNKRRLQELKQQGMKKIELLPFEKCRVINHPPINFLTLFQGSYKATRVYLAARVYEIVRANPWLASQIERDENGEFALYYPDDISNVKRYYEHAPVAFFSKHKPYDETVQELTSAFCRSTTESSGNCEPLWKITLVPDENFPDERFAVVASANHSLMDGHTMYQLFNMLSVESSIQALNPIREMNSSQMMDEKLGNEMNVYSTWGFIARALLRALLKNFLPHRESIIYEVSTDWIAAKKKEVIREGEMQFVSSNDVIFSTFCKNLHCCDFSRMLVNFRGRIPELTDDLAGNYVSNISYTAADFASPSLIRKSLTSPTMGRAAIPKTPLPSNLDFILSTKMALVSNWATIAKKLVLNGCEELFHVPLYKKSDTLFFCFDAMIIFRLAEGKLGIIASVENSSVKKLETCGLILRRLSF